MWLKIASAAWLLLITAGWAESGGAKPWVKVKPTVLPAGTVIPKITFEVKMPVDAPAGSVVEVEIPYHFGLPQTENPDGDNYLSGKPPRKTELELSAEIASARSYVVRAAARRGELKKGHKFKLFLINELTHPFDHEEKAFLVYVKGPAAEDGTRPILAEGQTTVVHIPGGPPASPAPRKRR